MAAETASPNSPGREAPHEERWLFTQRTLQRELEDLSSRLQRHICIEMERFMSDALTERVAADQADLSSQGRLVSCAAGMNCSLPEESSHAMLGRLVVSLPDESMLPGSLNSASNPDSLGMTMCMTMKDSLESPDKRSRRFLPSQQQMCANLSDEALDLECLKDEPTRSRGTVGEAAPGGNVAGPDCDFPVIPANSHRQNRRKSALLAWSRRRSSGDSKQLQTLAGGRQRGAAEKERRSSLNWPSAANGESLPGRRASACSEVSRSFGQSVINVTGMSPLTSGSNCETTKGQDSVTLNTDGLSSSDSASSQATPPISHAHSMLLRLVKSSRFDAVSGILVSLNAISIGWQTDYMAIHSTDSLPPVFRVFDTLFCIVFTAELLLRILAHGKDYLFCQEWRWNVFDVAMVAMQIFEEIATLITAGSEEQSSGVPGGSNFSYLRLLRLVRLVRVLRMVRVLRFIAELRKLVYSIGNSLQSLAWTLVLLMFMLYVVGVCFTQLISHHIRSVESPTRGEEKLHTQFGSLGASVLSLFQAISGGMDWEDISRPLRDVHWALELLFALYIAFAVLAMLNVITGVFVETAVQSSTQDQEDDFVARFREFYLRTNLSTNGSLTRDAFEEYLKKKDVVQFFSHQGINVGQAKNLFDLLDVDDSGEIDADEFVMGCCRLRGPARSLDLVTLMYDNKRMLGQVHDVVCHLAHT